jgi:hypothetical protein
MRGDSRTHSGENVGDGQDKWRDPGIHGPARIKSASNAGSVFKLTKNHIAGVNKAEEPAYGRTILMNATKMVTLRRTMET